MAANYWLLVAVGILIAVLAIIARIITKGRQTTDYYSLFLGGIVWLLFGIAMKSTIFLAGAAILLMIGYTHKNEWKTQKENKNAKYALAIGLITALLLAAYFQSAGPKATDFESCVAAGNPVMERYPRQCRADGITYTEKISDVIECKPEQRNADVCAAIFQPVCAKVNIQCIRAPCNPIDETFPNSCEACRNPLVESYRMGECQ